LVALQIQMARFVESCKRSPARKKGPLPSLDAVPKFLNGRTLRDYQLESLKWHVNNMRAQRNCILGDEMVRTLSTSLLIV